MLDAPNRWYHRLFVLYQRIKYRAHRASGAAIAEPRSLEMRKTMFLSKEISERFRKLKPRASTIRTLRAESEQKDFVWKG